DDAQRNAYEQWRAARILERDGISIPQPSAPILPPPPGAAPDALVLVALIGGVYVLLLVVAASLAFRAASGERAAFAAVAAVMRLGSTAALSVGRFGAASGIEVRQSTVLHQLTPAASAVRMRAVVAFPAYDAFHVRLDLPDSMLQAKSPYADEWFDEDG